MLFTDFTIKQNLVCLAAVDGALTVVKKKKGKPSEEQLYNFDLKPFAFPLMIWVVATTAMPCQKLVWKNCGSFKKTTGVTKKKKDIKIYGLKYKSCQAQWQGKEADI